MPLVVFVCSGNVFRSPAAERLAHLYATNNIHFSSAGIYAELDNRFHKYTIQALQRHKADPDYHFPRQLDDDIVASANLLVPMGTNHKDWIDMCYSIDAPLFNQIAYGQKTPLLDYHEIPKNPPVSKKEYVDYVVNYLARAMPSFMRNLPNFLE